MMKVSLQANAEARRLGDQNELAVGTRLQDFFVCAGSLSKRQFLPDDRPQCAILHPGD